MQRNQGKTWKQVQQDINKKFGISPPSLRVLDNWNKTLDREKISQLLIEESFKKIYVAKEDTLQQMAAGLLPMLWKAHDVGEDMEKEAYVWFFSVIERQLGQAKFDQYIEEYRARRTKIESSA